jgi:LEA14-like dessication related protein
MANYAKKLGIMALCCFLCSCTSWFVEKPAFQVSGISLSLRSMKTLNGSVTVAVHNPNFYDLVLDSFTYRVKLGDKSLSEGISQESIKIPGKTQTEIKIPLQAEFSNMESVVRMCISEKEVPYEIEGSVHIKALWTDWLVPFSREGVLKF